MVNGCEIRLTGMSRSGNHAIINWIWRQAEGRKCLLNCAEGGTNPFASCRPLDDGRPWRVNYGDFDIAAERRGRFSAKDLLVHSYEDTFLARVYNGAFESQHDALVGPTRRRVDVLVLRDPFNLFASRRALAASPVTPRAALRVWKQHAREFLGERGYLRHDRLTISYNRWVCDRAYRAGLAARLGLGFSDSGIDAVTACAGGSSFDGLAYDGDAGRMRVFDRWRHFLDDAEYWALFDEATVALARRIFGAATPTLAWVAWRRGERPLPN